MTPPTDLERDIQADPNRLRVFLQERAIHRTTELIESILEKRSINRTTLAGMLGVSKGWVTQLLDGESNKTIRTVADVLAVLGCEFDVVARKIQVSNKSDAFVIRYPSVWNADETEWQDADQSIQVG